MCDLLLPNRCEYVHVLQDTQVSLSLLSAKIVDRRQAGNSNWEQSLTLLKNAIKLCTSAISIQLALIADSNISTGTGVKVLTRLSNFQPADDTRPAPDLSREMLSMFTLLNQQSMREFLRKNGTTHPLALTGSCAAQPSRCGFAVGEATTLTDDHAQQCAVTRQITAKVDAHLGGPSSSAGQMGVGKQPTSDADQSSDEEGAVSAAYSFIHRGEVYSTIIFVCCSDKIILLWKKFLGLGCATQVFYFKMHC